MTPSVNSFLATLAHPRAADIGRLRAVILAAHPDIREGIKWNAPSYATSDHFCTFHLRDPKGAIALIFHTGARSKTVVRGRVADPLLEWLADDRARVTVADAAWIDGHADALTALIRRWLTMLSPAGGNAG